MAVGALIATPGSAQSNVPLPLGESAAKTKAQKVGVTLKVRVRGARNLEGRLALALFNSESAFPDQEKAYRGRLVRLSKTTQVVSFSGLVPGKYAVAVLHDENSNGKMDFNFIGIPTEGFGFSNDASEPFGPPSFGDSAFQVGRVEKQISLSLRYYL